MQPVSYSTHPTKAVEIPFSKDGSARCQAVDDFQVYGTHSAPVGRTEMKIGYDCDWIYVDVVCHEPSGVLLNSNDGKGDDVWNGNDMLEIFFGSCSPEPWQFQFAVNAAGQRFDSRGSADEWAASMDFKKDEWRIRLAFPFAIFPNRGLSIGFNLCRYAMHRKEISDWGGIEVSFHEFENFGELLFCTYEQALFAKTGRPVNRKLTRPQYERELAKASVPANVVIHKPLCSHVTTDSAVVSFGTAGNCGAYIYYRKKGVKGGLWHKMPIALRNGLVSQAEAFHRAVLLRLHPGTEYEYVPVTLAPVSGKLLKGRGGRFRTMDKESKDFSFVFISDVHSTASLMDAIVKSDAVAKCDFIVNAGDPLSRGNGYDTVYRGLFDPLAGTGKSVVFVRGNHEQVGAYAQITCDMIANPSGKTYFTFTQGDVMFIALDVGDDHPDTLINRNERMIAEEIRWLRQLKRQSAFRNARRRIVLMHIPPCDIEHSYAGKASATVLNELADCEISCALCGHIHEYFVVGAGTGVRNFIQTGKKKADSAKLPFPIIANSNDTYLDVRVTESNVTCTAIRVDGSIVDVVRM